MGEARRLAIQCSAAERYGTPLYRTCDALRVAVDDLAEALTGDGTYFPSEAPRRWPIAHLGALLPQLALRVKREVCPAVGYLDPMVPPCGTRGFLSQAQTFLRFTPVVGHSVAQRCVREVALAAIITLSAAFRNHRRPLHRSVRLAE
jgi:hypothetical protein